MSIPLPMQRRFENAGADHWLRVFLVVVRTVEQKCWVIERYTTILTQQVLYLFCCFSSFFLAGQPPPSQWSDLAGQPSPSRWSDFQLAGQPSPSWWSDFQLAGQPSPSRCLDFQLAGQPSRCSDFQLACQPPLSHWCL